MAMSRAADDAASVSPSGRGRDDELRADDRILRDEEGHLLRVREVCFADARPSLIFESEVSFRRVRDYPRSWRQLGDEELYALSWGT